MDLQTTDLENSVIQKIRFGEELITSTNIIEDLDGLSKLKRKISQEIKFLRKILKNKTYKKEHLQCSNLTHFSALLDVLINTKDVIHVNKVFMLEDRKIIVDIVCENGLRWIKVIARNLKSLKQMSIGDTSYGVRNILDQAKDYAECSKLYPCLFQKPIATFVFTNGVPNNLALKIRSYGIQIEGDIIQDLLEIEDFYEDTSSNSSDEILNNIEHHPYSDDTDCIMKVNSDNTDCISKVNLDVSAMLAYCSSVTNGSAGKYEFDVPVLAQQAEWELSRPQKPILDKFFEGKSLYCCETAKKNFVNIVDTVGGPNEKIRAELFLERIITLPDDAHSENMSDKAETLFAEVQYSKEKVLNLGGKIRERSLTIFTFGDRIKAVTVTANEGFVRAAKQQGINFVVFLHESRALTEQKEHAKGTKKER